MRDSSFDIMKGIAILLVVLGHSVPDQASASGIASYPLYLMRTIIYSFHMPVFFFVAGYFMHIPLKEGFQKFVKDKDVYKRQIYSLLLVKVSHNGLLMNLIRNLIYVLVYGILKIIHIRRKYLISCLPVMYLVHPL